MKLPLPRVACPHSTSAATTSRPKPCPCALSLSQRPSSGETESASSNEAMPRHALLSSRRMTKEKLFGSGACTLFSHRVTYSLHVLAPRWRLPWHESGDGGRDASKNLLCIHHLELAELQSWGLDDNHCVSLSTTDNTSIDSWQKQLAQACAVCSPFLRSKRATAIFADDCSPQEVCLKTADFQTVYVGEDDDMV